MYRQTVERPPFRWWQTLLLTAGIIVFEVAFYLVLRLCEVPHPTIWSGLLLLAVFVITFVIALFYDVSYRYTADADTLRLEKRLGKLTLRSFSCPIRGLTLDAPGAGACFAYSRKKGRTVISKAGRAVFAPDETMLSCLTDPAGAYIDLHKDELLSELSALIAIPSVKGDPSEGCPFGKDCARALDYTLSLCEKLGMKTKNVDGYCGWAEAGQGDKLIGILCHLDVVPVGDGWDSDPFTAVVRDGFVFGRGAIDDKGPAVAAIYALAAAKEAGELKSRVRLIFGCDEESGWGCMDRYTASEELPDMAFTPDAEYPLIIAEKGIAHLTLNTGLTEGDYQLYLRGGLRPNMVPDKVHATLIGPMDRLFAKLNAYDVHQDNLSFDQSGDRLEIDAVGVGAHGSMPDKGVNAFFALFRFLEYLDLGASQGEFVKAVNRLLTDKTDGSGLDLALSDEASGALTVNLGMGFIGKNDVFPDMTDDACRLVLDIRYPVSYSLADVTARVDAVLPATWECTVGHGQAPLQMPEDSALVKTLMSVWHDHTGRDDKPIAIGGGTYARALPGKAVAFGVQFPGAPDKAHQPNESVRVDDLLLSAKMFADAILRLSADE